MRPFSLHHAVERPKPIIPGHRYSEDLQVAVLAQPDSNGDEVPLIRSKGDDDDGPIGPGGGKKWRTKMKSNGDEGEEEDFGWEESI